MTKTKLGISAALFSAIAYLCGYINFIAVVAVALVAVIWSEDDTAKKNSVQSLLLSCFFIVLNSIFGGLAMGYSSLISSVYEVNYDLANVLSKLNVFSGISTFLDVAKLVIFVILFFVALKGTVIKIPVINSLVSKHFPEN